MRDCLSRGYRPLIIIYLRQVLLAAHQRYSAMKILPTQHLPGNRLVALIVLAFGIALAGSLSGCQSQAPEQQQAGAFSRYASYFRGELPERYQGLSNPLPTTAAHRVAGATLYQSHCAACHGATGKGDGPAGEQLIPAPANLSFTRMTPIGSDQFFFWTISEGGKPLGTAMPVFADQLKDEQIWQIVRYVREGF